MCSCFFTQPRGNLGTCIFVFGHPYHCVLSIHRGWSRSPDERKAFRIFHIAISGLVMKYGSVIRLALCLYRMPAEWIFRLCSLVQLCDGLLNGVECTTRALYITPAEIVPRYLPRPVVDPFLSHRGRFSPASSRRRLSFKVPARRYRAAGRSSQTGTIFTEGK